MVHRPLKQHGSSPLVKSKSMQNILCLNVSIYTGNFGVKQLPKKYFTLIQTALKPPTRFFSFPISPNWTLNILLEEEERKKKKEKKYIYVFPEVSADYSFCKQ